MHTFQLMKILPQVYVVLNGYYRICRKMEIDLDLYQIFLFNIDWMIHSFLTRLSKMKSRCQSYSKWNLFQSKNTKYNTFSFSDLNSMFKKMNSNTDCYLNNNEKISFEFFINMNDNVFNRLKTYLRKKRFLSNLTWVSRRSAWFSNENVRETNDEEISIWRRRNQSETLRENNYSNKRE